MKSWILPFTLCLLLNTILCTATAQNIYSKAYGDKNNPAVIYVHGGPRGNATLFEGTAAQALADRGFYVIAYDRRGEGRSIDTTATFTFQEAFTDLNNLIVQYELKKVNILGHSFGGIVATLYADAHPEKVARLILVGALFSQQQTYDHILNTVKKLATIKKDTATIHKIARIKSLNKNSAAYRKRCYEVAADYGYFRMPYPTEASRKMNEKYTASAFAKANIRNDAAPILFYQNEKQVNIDTRAVLKNIKTKDVQLAAVYGAQDGIFSAAQMAAMKKIVGKNKFYSIDNCSHYPFVDQSAAFLTIIEKLLKD